jgi:hypothetical protein
VQQMIADGATLFTEVGPGKATSIEKSIEKATAQRPGFRRQFS